MVMRQLIDEFLLAGQANGWSRATHRQYDRHLSWLAGWLEEHGATALEDVTRTLLRSWLAEKRQNWAPATCKVAVTVLRSWLAFCEAEGYGGANLATAVKVPHVPERVQRAVDRHEVEAMLHVCEEPARSGLTPAQGEATRLRNAALVAVLFDSILRASELCGLDVGDVYPDRLRLAVKRKGGKEQLVRFSERTADYLREWLLVRPGFAAPGETALFTAITGNTPGCRLTTNGLRIVVKRLAERAGVADLSPHAFRRGGTVQAIELGAPDRMVQLHGGWSKVSMVTTYSRTLVADERFDAYQPMRAVNGAKSPLARRMVGS